MKHPVLRILAAALLVIATLKMSYSFYVLLKIFITFLALYFTIPAFKEKNETFGWLFGLIALLFNPILEFHFPKSAWIVIDLISAVVFLWSISALKFTANKS